MSLPYQFSIKELLNPPPIPEDVKRAHEHYWGKNEPFGQGRRDPACLCGHIPHEYHCPLNIKK